MPTSMETCPQCHKGTLYLFQGVLYCSQNCGYSAPAGNQQNKKEEKKKKQKK